MRPQLNGVVCLLVDHLEPLRAEFLGMVSHELRMPLTSMWGPVMAMQENTEDLDPVEIRQLLCIILYQVGSMRDLIGGLLDVARIETGTTLPINPKPARVATLVDRESPETGRGMTQLAHPGP